MSAAENSAPTGCQAVIQASKPELRIMRYELTDHEWVAIRPMLPNKQRGMPRVNDRRVRGGLTSTIHAVVSGLPVRLALTTGEAHDNRLATKLLSGLTSRSMLPADRGYDADWIRAIVRQHGAWANIPPKRKRTETLCFNSHLYRTRNLVERFFNKNPLRQARGRPPRIHPACVNKAAAAGL
jgi:transposase